MIKKWVSIVLTIVAFFLCTKMGVSPSNATTLSSMDWKASGDGLLTYDSSTNLQWLKITQTFEMSQYDVEKELGINGLFSGFSVATVKQFSHLFSYSLGLNFGGPGPIDPLSQSQYELVSDALELFGYYDSGPNGSYQGSGLPYKGFKGRYGNTIGHGPDYPLLFDHQVANLLLVGDDSGFIRGTADIVSDYYAYNGLGTFLCRTAPVPEPSTFFLLGSGLTGLAWYGRKRKKA